MVHRNGGTCFLHSWYNDSIYIVRMYKPIVFMVYYLRIASANFKVVLRVSNTLIHHIWLGLKGLTSYHEP